MLSIPFLQNRQARTGDDAELPTSDDTTSTEKSVQLVAIERWQRVADSDERNVEARLFLYGACVAAGQADEADRLVEELDTRFGDALQARLAVARHLMRKGDSERAFERWTGILERQPDHVEALNSLAHLHLRLDNLDDAQRLADTLDEHPLVTTTTHRLRARIHEGREDWGAAAREWRDQIAADASDTDASVQLISALMAAQQLDEAEAEADAALERTPDDTRLLLAKERLLHRSERFAEALVMIDAIVASGTEDAALLARRAKTLYRLDRLGEAEQACETALDASPDDIALLTLHARIAQANLSRSRAA